MRRAYAAHLKMVENARRRNLRAKRSLDPASLNAELAKTRALLRQAETLLRHAVRNSTSKNRR